MLFRLNLTTLNEMLTPRKLSVLSPYHPYLIARLVLILSFCAGSIIAVHGLGSNSDTAWQSRTSLPLEGSSGHAPSATKPMWLRDFLPQDLKESGFNVRVMVFKHNTGWKSNALSKSLEDYGQDLLRELSEKRQSEEVSDQEQLTCN